ncbi:hypothetical protein ENUP19_0359G0005 [Entamoeba nuttalli]|uniref:CXXC-rich protein n=2 Tax=Entamoeba nuttalli TaxID=412467 RepID=A0ABQ0DY89_9EUKA
MVLVLFFIVTCFGIECPNNTFFDNGKCVTCSPYCVEGKCDIEKGCVECVNHFQESNKLCESSCEENKYYDGDDCVGCSEHCINGYCDKLDGCTLCQRGYLAFNKTCIDTSCGELCKPGYCQSGVCSKCVDNYVLINNTCFDNSCNKCEVGHCSNGYCDDCIKGWYVYQAQCWECPSNCTESGCEDGYGCTECVDGMHLDSGRCEVNIPEEENKEKNWRLGLYIICPLLGILIIGNVFVIVLYIIRKFRNNSYTSLSMN